MTPGDRLWRDTINAEAAARRIRVRSLSLADVMAAAEAVPGFQAYTGPGALITTGRSDRSGASRVSAAPGSSPRASAEATAINTAFSTGSWSDIATIRAIFGDAVDVSIVERFQIPPGSFCQPLPCLAPPVDAQTASESAHLLDEGDADARIRNCPNVVQAVHSVALNFLRQNEDIWRWILCMVLSDTALWDGGDLIDDILSTGDWPLRCLANTGACAVTTTPTGTSQATHHTNAVFGTTLICEGNPLVEAVASVWSCGSGAERMMAVIQLSAILLHELCHLAWYVGDGTDRTGCRRVEAVELTFIWACLQRYPDALNAPCASPFTSLGIDALFLNGENGVANNIVMDLSSCTTNCDGAREARVTAGSRTAAAEWLIGDRTFAAPNITSAAPPPDRASPP